MANWDLCFKSATTSVDKCAQRAAQFLSGEERDTSIKKLYDVMESYCMLEEQVAITAASMAAAKSAIEEQDEDELTFKQAFEQQMDQRLADVKDLKRHPKYIKFDRNVKSILAEVAGNEKDVTGGDDDDELVVTEAQLNDIDPISQQVMVFPVKNKICGHAYEKENILTMLKVKKRMRCPYVGCPNRNHFTSDDLEDDEELKRYLKRQRSK